MKRIVLDANVLLSYLTDRDLHQQEAASRLFDEAAEGEHALVLHQVAITEMVYVLRNIYRVEKIEIAAMIRDVLALPGIVVMDEIVWSLLLDLWPGRFNDFGDAALATVAIDGRYDAVATFDNSFARQLERQGLAPYFR
jgi:predicted nucleic acid-binding protein